MSKAPLTPFYFEESQALKLEIPSYPEEPIQIQPATASPLTTGGLSWETTLAGAEMSPRGMLSNSPVSALNYSFATGGPLMPETINNIGVGYFSPVSPTMNRKMSTVSSSWSDAFAGTPLGSPCTPRKFSTISPARSPGHSPSCSDGFSDKESPNLMQVDLYVLLYLNIEIDERGSALLTLAKFRDQLYWEKVHQFAPIIHQRRYFSWSRRQDKSAAQIALQYSMWTLAASAAPDCDQLTMDRLHRCASQALQVIENTDDPTGLKQSSDLERVQAQLLLSMYEFKHINFRQGWNTAGYAFRSIQLGWLQDIISGMNLLPDSMDWTELEEKRRTFWLAFYLDRIISLRSDSPCIFAEEVSFHWSSYRLIGEFRC